MGSTDKVVTADTCYRSRMRNWMRIYIFSQPHRLDRCAGVVSMLVKNLQY